MHQVHDSRLIKPPCLRVLHIRSTAARGDQGIFSDKQTYAETSETIMHTYGMSLGLSLRRSTLELSNFQNMNLLCVTVDVNLEEFWNVFRITHLKLFLFSMKIKLVGLYLFFYISQTHLNVSYLQLSLKLGN